MPTVINSADLRSALPDVTSTLSAAGLDSPVTIIRDHFGIPHIKAQTEHDVFFAQGFVTAQDRLWHMDQDRQRGLGRFAEWVGTSGVAQDKLIRTLGLESAAKADYTVSRDDTKSMVDAHTAGINFFIKTTRSLPVEYKVLGTTPEPWESWHSYVAYKMRNILMGHLDMKLWRARVVMKLGVEKASQLFEGYPNGMLVTTPSGAVHSSPNSRPFDELAEVWTQLNPLYEVDAGSNAWVVGGQWTTSGLPLVAGDSHRGLDTPSVYYQIHMVCEGHWAISGYALPGIPGAPHFSHTEWVGFGMTHGSADYQDVYMEAFRQSADGHVEYQTESGWVKAAHRSETIHAKGGESLTFEVVTTRHGPIVEGDVRGAGIGLAAKLTGIDPDGTKWMDAVLDIIRAKSADELEQAVEEWTEPVNNYMYADVHGEYGYRLRGKIPIRTDDAGSWVPVDGTSGKHQWKKFIPLDEMPHVRNPEEGYAVTCNQRVTTDDYPYVISQHFGSDHRAQRVTARILEVPLGKMDVSEMGKIHKERMSITAGQVKAAVARVSPSALNPGGQNIASMLEAWDGDMQPHLNAPTAFAAVIQTLTKEVVPSIFGQLGQEILGGGRGGPAHWGNLRVLLFQEAASGKMDGPVAKMLPPGTQWETMFASAVNGAAELLLRTLGDPDTSDWSWGTNHRTAPTHPLARLEPSLAPMLNPPSVSAGGGFDTPNAASYSTSGAQAFVGGEQRRVPYNITGLSVNRYIHDPSDWTKSQWIAPLGASGHPGSPHYADQAELWSRVETISQLWEWADVENAAETQQLLQPISASKI